ncbi:origin recognition complex subunit 3 N-terminus-domain-containing protein [Mycotypha africana]|uniref:origin recognition complex subunit 3 N-terminus-domain-containing protein n=1 Tax=Mycotypha africana TaxID=64632 RepID=UPI002301BC2A|nr:origin recognition complex subunit 3 N-terminus-domain-containing protein [Mycotypha africana]KAI8977502.1 origin recognition complex subunit 3 N-terminus-domain-containing protein [Mycotypha africana]
MSLLEGNFDSVSEGCFLVMPGKKRSRVLSTSLPKSKRAKPLKATSIKATHRSEWKSKESQHDGFQLLYNGREPLKAMLKRKEFLSTCWKTVEDLFNESLLGINQAAIQEICDFVNKDHDMTHHSLPFHEIPTGLVFAGINTPDHSTQFEYIATQLRAKTGTKKENYVALLQSKDCMNLKNMMKSMIERFMASATEEDGSEKTDIVEDTTTDAQEEEEEEEGDEEDMIRFTEVK